jgi:hypothetical protein
MGSSFGKEAMSTLGEKTVEVVERLKIPETLDELAQQTKGAFEIKVSLDVSHRLKELIERLFIWVPLLMIIVLIVFAVAYYFIALK